MKLRWRSGFALALVSLLLLPACDNILDVQPLDQPSDQTFFSNGDELELAVNAAYRNLTFNVGGGPFEAVLEGATDIGWVRQNPDGIQDIGRGGHDSQTSLIRRAWVNYYQGISKANNLLQNMERAQDATNPNLYSRIEGEARFLRAYFYHRLVELYGDVPLITELQTLEEAEVARTPKQEVVDFILADLDAAAAKLPVTYPASEKGRATKGAALALKSRVALYNERWDVAAAAAQEVMNLGVYELHDDYQSLFTYAGENSPEMILQYGYLIGVNTHQLPQYVQTRNVSGWSVFIPQQTMVDSYEMIDGKTIDESPLYNPARPFENRDPRLQASIVVPGSEMGGYRFETHPDSTETWNYVTQSWVENKDVTNPYASFSGYVWRKFMDPIDLATLQQSELDWPLIRYAEVLLNYAEAKVEAGQIDQSVYDALNSVRERAGVPAVTAGTQNELREVIRRERKVELAFEGFRLFDIRRWQIAETAMPHPVLGRPKREYKETYVPKFDANGIPNYSAYQADLRFVEDRSFNPARDYLWPIPQSEMDVNTKLVQNPGYGS